MCISRLYLPAEHLEDHGWKLRGLCSFGWWNFHVPLTFFCRILCAESVGDFHFDYLNFDSMTFGTARARRLSTASSVTKPPHYILTTEWVWYWIDEFGSWQEYGRQVSVMERGPVIPSWASISKSPSNMCPKIVLGVSDRAKDLQMSLLTALGGIIQILLIWNSFFWASIFEQLDIRWLSWDQND